jgi:hypothetical protein
MPGGLLEAARAGSLRSERGGRAGRRAKLGRVDRDAVHAFLDRGWREAERLEREHWAEVRRTAGPEANLRAAWILVEHMRRLRPGWPTEAERAADFAHHVALKRWIDRAAGAFAAR